MSELDDDNTVPNRPPAAELKTPVSPKVIAASAVALVAPAVLSMLFFLQTDEGSALLGGIPIVLRIFLQALIVSAATLVGGYMTRDRLRDEGAAYIARRAAGL